ncbi:MAG TPA: alginate export family protein [Clostridia bacterium]|nr:alginate export family protein [Clostridia bacterium]
MTTKVRAFTLLSLGAPLLAAQAQTAQPALGAAPAAPLSPVEQAIKDIKNPVSWLTWGGDLRFRNEYFNNGQTLTSDPALNPRFAPLHEQDYFRFRGRLWTSITPVENLSLNARVAAEPRVFMKPASFGSYFGQSGAEWRYGIVDNLNVQWKRPLDLPANIIVGRQDLVLGDGWLMVDGTPVDGSWTFFVDAARITYELKDQHTTIDAVGLMQFARPDAWLPTIGSSTDASPAGYFLTDQNEKGAILWVANKSIPTVNVDGYFMYKHDTRVNNPPTGRSGDNADIYTVGARLSGLVQDHWKYSAEGAYQFGEKQDPTINNALLDPKARTSGYRDISAFGVNTKLSYLFKDKLNNQIGLAYEFLSGDDPGTKGDEMFDVLWGRWPRWSEIYNVYSYIPETRVAQTANLHRFGPTYSLTPMKNMDFSLSYYLLFSDEDVPTRANVPTIYSGDNNFRGHYLQAWLKYKFSAHLSGHLWGEVVFPGNYYQDRDTISWLRAEVLLTF